MLLKQYIDAIEILKKCNQTGRKVYIRGTKEGALLMHNELQNAGINVTGFVDIIVTADNSIILDLPVMLMDELYKQPKENYYIVCSQNDIHTYFKVREDLESHGLIEKTDFYHFGNLGFSFQRQPENAIINAPYLMKDKSFESLHKRNYDALMSYYYTRCKPFLPEIKTDFLTKNVFFSKINLIPNLSCTLNCKYCCAGCQYSSHKAFDWQQIVEDFDKMLSVSKVLCAGILGGELFLHKNIADIFRAFSKMKNIKNCECVEVFTNATVMPSDDALEAFNKIDLPKFFMISNYKGLNDDNSEFIKKLDKFNIKYEIFPDYHLWNHPGDIKLRNFEKINYTDEEMNMIKYKCWDFFGGWTILEGKLYPCGFNVYALYPKLKDYVDIRNCRQENLENELFDFIYKKESYDLCAYCRGTFFGNEKIAIAEQL